MFGFDPKIEDSIADPPALKRLESQVKEREQKLIGLIEDLEDEVGALQLEAQRAESVPRPPAHGVM